MRNTSNGSDVSIAAGTPSCVTTATRFAVAGSSDGELGDGAVADDDVVRAALDRHGDASDHGGHARSSTRSATCSGVSPSTATVRSATSR